MLRTSITMLNNSRWRLLVLFSTLFLILLFMLKSPIPTYSSYSKSSYLKSSSQPSSYGVFQRPDCSSTAHHDGTKFQWACVKTRYPVSSMRSPPVSGSNRIPKIQAKFRQESSSDQTIRLERLKAVRGNFTHAWEGYKAHAWLRDEVMPVSGRPHDPFGGWAATLVDSLDTLWIMGLHDEFCSAVKAIELINFSTFALEEINVFETTVRYLGGLLAAYDLSGGKYPTLLQKAGEIGDMLYVAFDTPNRMPIVKWNFKAAATGAVQEASENVLAAEIGSLTLEFTRLSQLTGDPRYFDAVQRIMDVFGAQQSKTKLPGMWPAVFNAVKEDFTRGSSFTIGGMANSLYEYLPKQYLLLGGTTDQYRGLFENAMTAMRSYIFYRPMTSDGLNSVLLAGQVTSDGKIPLAELKTEPQAQHLGCFAGGMVCLAAKIFSNNDDMEIGRKLVEGCLWGYENMPNGIMPEIMHTVPCPSQDRCDWDRQKWIDAVNAAYDDSSDGMAKIRDHHLPEGVTKVDDVRYILRPEAIESLFILYRLTGDISLRERAWTMFNNIIRPSLTDIAHSALDDCMVETPPKADRMDSFWMAETLKYFYLMFSPSNIVSLDEYVFNTRAHPLRRPH